MLLVELAEISSMLLHTVDPHFAYGPDAHPVESWVGRRFLLGLSCDYVDLTRCLDSGRQLDAARRMSHRNTKPKARQVRCVARTIPFFFGRGNVRRVDR